MKKKILVLGTGGTIASKDAGAGLVPASDVSELLSYIPEAESLCDLHQLQVFSLDSTNVQPHHWLLLAQTIEKHYEEYDGFLILHGTDTMAYTAAALSYLIQHSPKPIVLTGSQLPMEDEHTDAKGNMLQSIKHLVRDDACDVSIVFDQDVIPGGRARKVRSHSMKAFECVGKKPEECIREKKASPEFYHKLNENVFIWKLVPGLKPDVLLNAAETFDGVVIEGFGLGGLPNIQENDYFPIIQSLIQKGKVVAVTTQVPMEGSDMSVYEVGLRYKKELPVLEGKLMTPEAMAVKLMWILGQTNQWEEVQKLFDMNINCDQG